MQESLDVKILLIVELHYLYTGIASSHSGQFVQQCFSYSENTKRSLILYACIMAEEGQHACVYIFLYHSTKQGLLSHDRTGRHPPGTDISFVILYSALVHQYAKDSHRPCDDRTVS